MEKFQIEIDVDGVLADMDGSYGAYVKDIIPDFCEEKYILEWNMPQVEKKYPVAYDRIKGLWTNPEFIYNLPRYPNIEKSLQKLYGIVKDIADIVIHTHIRGKNAVYDSRYLWLNELKEDTEVDFKIEISTDDEKGTRKNSKFIIEDNVSNLRKSNADFKILVRRGHNRNYQACDLGDCEKSYVVNSFCDAVEIIENYLNSEVDNCE